MFQKTQKHNHFEYKQNTKSKKESYVFSDGNPNVWIAI